ncbi:hypothetical protein DdX_09838 [Ditylenchus destructor]|uniref:Uncharacterized protein n=1 Tax=Ditylenchus destructor TaxID=166010 RepID=A0AAD4MZM4_9BILA|nr:hypothetical protein DdX_09838 [Ditylenchus destructor]
MDFNCAGVENEEGYVYLNAGSETDVDAPSKEICVHILIDGIPIVLKIRVPSKEHDDFRMLDLYIDGNRICRRSPRVSHVSQQ